MEQRMILSAGSIASDPVRNSAGDHIGVLKDLMIELASGRVPYVVVSYGGFLGLGDKLFAMPWRAVRVDQQNKSIVVDLDAEKLAAAPGFDKDNWPDFSSPTWLSEIDTYYGVESDWLLT